MEAVATDAVLLVKLIGNGIHESLGRHGLVEGGVEDAHLGQTGHKLLDGVDALQVGGVVQGSQVRALLEGLEYLVGEDD